MAQISMTELEEVRVTVGVDTHKDLHVARPKDQLGRSLGEITVPALGPRLRRPARLGPEIRGDPSFGVEGTGCYGAGLARYLRRRGVVVVEVIRPNRQVRRRGGKSDPADAAAAASAVLSGEANGAPKAGDATVGMIRALRVARTTAIRARTQAINALHALVITAPEELRERLRDLSGPGLVRTCARFHAGDLTDTLGATKTALRSLAKRYLALKKEVQTLDQELDRLTVKACPALLGIFGAGSDTAGTLALAARDNPQRLRGEAAFAKLCGVSPVEASSGMTTRHRLNRGGDRHANAASFGSSW